MKKRNIVSSIVGLVLLAVPVIAKKVLLEDDVPEADNEGCVVEKYYGIPLEELNRIAQSINYRNYCTVNDGYLILHYKSNHGHQTFQAWLYVDKNGKLASRNPGFAYEGQVRSGESEFLKRVNASMVFQ